MYSTGWMTLPSAAFQVALQVFTCFPGIQRLCLPPFHDSFCIVLISNPASKLLISLESKPNCAGCPTSRTRLKVSSLEPSMLARPLLSKWRLPVVLPQYACGLHCSAAGWDNAVLCATGTRVPYGKMLLLRVAG